MQFTRRNTLALGAGLLGTRLASAQSYPTRPVTFIIPFGAGGGTDLIARTMSDDLTKALQQPIIIEPRPGANGAIGSAVVARATPDGYTLLMTASSTYSLNPNLMKDPPYDQVKDFVGVATIGRAPWLLTVPPDSPFKTAADVVAFGKANPGKLAFPFWQSSILVTGETFASEAGIQMRKVPYKGVVECTTDFLAGRLPLFFVDIANARPQVEAGKMRIIATTTAQRSATYPDVPTLREGGLDVVTDSMVAVFAPTGTPKPIIDRLNVEISKIVETSEPVRARFKQTGIDPATMKPEQFDAFVRSELTRWEGMIRKAGLEKS